jgi:hypothetical protein
MYSSQERMLTLLDRALVGLLLLLLFVLIGVQVANAAEIIPAVGVTKSVDGDEKADVFGSLAFRAPILPLLKTELGIAYRSEDRFDDALKLRMWPVTASLWLTPIPALYAGGGVGWYNITFDYDQDRVPFPIEDETQQEFGVHLGGGLMVPIGTSAGLDLNGRYVMMRDQSSRLIPEKFDPDFWTSSLGLAIRF